MVSPTSLLSARFLPPCLPVNKDKACPQGYPVTHDSRHAYHCLCRTLSLDLPTVIILMISAAFLFARSMFANTAQPEPYHFLVCGNVFRAPVFQQMHSHGSLLVRRSNSLSTWPLFTICPLVALSKSHRMEPFLTPRTIRQPLPWARRLFTTAINSKSPLTGKKLPGLSGPCPTLTSVLSFKVVAPVPKGPTP